MINKINPLYLICLLITLVIVTQTIKSNGIEYFNDLVLNLEQTKKDAKAYNEYKNQWEDSRQKINAIINNSTFKKENIKTKKLKDKFEIEYISKDKQKLERFLNNILNNYIFMEKIKISKNEIRITTRLKK